MNRLNVSSLAPSECYEIYVGGTIVQEFVCGFESVDGVAINRIEPSQEAIVSAVNDLIFNWPHEGEPPAGIEEKLIAYCQEQLGL